MARNPKITFIGAGSTVFMKNIVGDVLQRPAAAAIDRRFEYRVEPLARDDETAAEGIVAVDE